MYAIPVKKRSSASRQRGDSGNSRDSASPSKESLRADTNASFQALNFEVSSSGDRSEKEAERVASWVSESSCGPAPRITPISGAVISRAGSSSDSTSRPDAAGKALANPGAGEPIPALARRRLESRIGADLSGVRVHRGTAAQDAAVELRARAFTSRNNIWLGKGESPDDISLMAHEATHVLQQGSGTGPVQRFPAQTDIVQRKSIWDDITGAAGAAWDATGGKLVDAAGKVVEMGEDFFWAMLGRLAPSLVPVLKEISSKGIFTFLYDRITSALGRIFDGLSARSETIAVLVNAFKSLMATAKDIFAALAAGDCKPMFAAIERLKDTVSEMAGEAWDRITEFFRPVGDFFSNLWQSFGAPVVDWLSKFAGDVWDRIKDLGAQIWDWTAPVRSALSKAWDWVKEKLGIGGEEGDGKGGLIQWVKGKASEAWESIKKKAEPVIAPIQAVAQKVKAILPLEAIRNLRDKVKGWLGNVNSMTASLNEEEGGVAANQDLLREKILPAVMASIGQLRLGIIQAGKWVAAQAGSLFSSITGFMEKLRSNSVLSIASSAIGWLEDKAIELSFWAQNTITGLFTAIGNGLLRMAGFVEPILDTLKKVFEVVGNLMGRLADLVFGKVWRMIPACIKNPIMDFIINRILKNIPVFGELLKLPDIWAKVKDTALRILKSIFVDGNLLKAAWTFFKSILSILGIPPDLVLSIVNKAATAVSDIISNPVNFLMNLLSAVKEGFSGFFSRIGTHLLGGVGKWLFGQVAEAGLKPPEDFSLKSIFSFVLDVLGITVDHVLERLEKKAGVIAAKVRSAINFLKGAWEWVVTLIKEGPAGLWRLIAEKISNLWNTVLDSVINWLSVTVIKQAAKKVLSMLDPTGIMAVVNSIIAIYKAIQSFVRYLKEMLEIVNSVLNGVLDIAKGVIEKAAGFVERSLSDAIPIAIGFLANQLGLGGLGTRIKEMVKAVREKIDAAIDWLIEKAIAAGTAIFGALKGIAGKVTAWWKRKASFKQGKESHTLSFEGEGTGAALMVSSTPVVLQEYLKGLRNTFKKSPKALKIIDSIEAEAKEVEKLKTDPETGKDEAMTTGKGKDIEKHFNKIATLLASPELGGTEAVPPSVVKWAGKPLMKDSVGTGMTAEPLSIDPGGNAGSAPFQESDIWLAVNRRKYTYVRGHLLNHHVHGPGENKNLIPIMRDLNTLMETRVESKVKDAVLGKKEVVSYKVNAVFAGHGERKNIPQEALLPAAMSFELNYMRLKEGDRTGKDAGDWEIDPDRSFDYPHDLPNNLPPDTAADVRPEKAEPVNLSKASKDEIAGAGIPPVAADEIVKLREKRDDKVFYSYAQLENAKGLDYKKLLELSDMGLVKLR